MDPRLRITRVLTRRTTISVAGTAARALDATATLTLRTKRGVLTRRARIANGRWQARFHVRPGDRPRTIRATTNATPAFAPGAARWDAPHTKRHRTLAHHPTK